MQAHKTEVLIFLKSITNLNEISSFIAFSPSYIYANSYIKRMLTMIPMFCYFREILVALWFVSTTTGWCYMGLSVGVMAVPRKISLESIPELQNTSLGSNHT